LKIKKEEKLEKNEEKKEETKESPKPNMFATSSNKPFTFDFGKNVNGNITWPTFTPMNLPSLSTNSSLPSFQLGSNISWPSFKPSNFDFTPPKIVSSPETKPKTTSNFTNLEALASPTPTYSKETVEEFKESVLKHKPIGTNIEEPVAPVQENTNVIEEPQNPTVTIQTNISNGEENEDILAKAKVKLYEFEKGENGSGWVNRGVGIIKLIKAKDSYKCRLVMRSEGVGNVLLNVALFGKMDVICNEGQKTLQFIGVNVKIQSSPTNKLDTFNLSFQNQDDKLTMLRLMREQIAIALDEEIKKTAEVKEGNSAEENNVEEVRVDDGEKS